MKKVPFPTVERVQRAASRAFRLDEAFSEELQRIFGKNAGNARYDYKKRGWSDRAKRLSDLVDKAMEIYTNARMLRRELELQPVI